jgi:hypothetical protein
VINGCWLARFSEVPCDGRLIRAHLVSKGRIKREFPHGAVYSLSDRRWVRDAPPERRTVLSAPRMSLDCILWDERVWVPACGGPTGCSGHHGAFDQKQLYVPRWALPAGVEDYAREYGLVWSLDRDYGLAEGVVA